MQKAEGNSGRLAGIDYGTVRIGIAITDPGQRIASPLSIYKRQDEAADAGFFRHLVAQQQIVGFVVGLPVHLDGRESPKSLEARQFGQWLQKTTGVSVVFFDERFTTAEAEQLLSGAELTKKQRKERLDKLAAQILLTAFLETRKPLGEQLLGLDE